MKKRFLLLAIMALFVAGCADDWPVASSDPSLVPIRPGVTSTLVPVPSSPAPAVDPANTVLTAGRPHRLAGGATITFLAVTEDSRCPAEVACVWEGELSGTVLWEEGGVETELELIWAYHHEPTLTPSGEFALGLWDVTTDSGSTVAHLEILPTG